MNFQFSRSVVSDSLRPHGLQHARPPCPPPTPRVHSDSWPSSRWCHPAISSSVVPFSSCLQSAGFKSLCFMYNILGCIKAAAWLVIPLSITFTWKWVRWVQAEASHAAPFSCVFLAGRGAATSSLHKPRPPEPERHLRPVCRACAEEAG